MHISAPFIRRRIATSLLSIAILLAGGVGFYFLPVAALPRVDFPTIFIRTSLPGASPETMASSVATPLERQFGRIAGITQMTSTSQLGATGITLQFDLDRDINAASRDVQAAINAACRACPPTAASIRLKSIFWIWMCRRIRFPGDVFTICVIPIWRKR